MKPRGFSATFTVLFVALMAGPMVSSGAAQVPPREAALEEVARIHGLEARELRVESEALARLPGLGRAAFYKISSADSVYGVVVDSRGGVWAPQRFRRAADSSYVQTFGKVDAALHRRLEEESGALIPVTIWLRVEDELFRPLRGADFIGHGVVAGDREASVVDTTIAPDALIPPPYERETAVARVAAQEERLAALRQEVASQVQNVATRMLERLASLDIRARAVPEAPAVSAVLTAEQILELGREPDVAWIYADDVENVDLNDSATGTHRAPAVWSRGLSGAGAEVAILEDSRAFDNFWLVIADTRDATDPNVDNHATETMGNVGSWHARYLGMARGSTLYSANATSYAASDLRSAANWAVSKGAHIINNSWGPNTPTGCLSGLGRFFDYKVFAYAPVITFAAGNSGNFVNDHAMAYNILAVGALDDQDNNDWTDDAIAGYSSRNEGTGCSPSNGDREEPDVVASGSRIRSTRMHPPSINVTNRQGTSYAAPMVAGEAALLLEKEPNLRWKPEAMRALIMTSAVNNVDGAARLSELDGAGGIDAYSAYLIAHNGWWLQQTIDPQSWGGTNLNIYAQAGDRIRCAVAWTSHPNSSATVDPLLTDVDLRLIDPGGSTVTWSLSWDNSYEIVDFTATRSGTWRCRAYRFSTTPQASFEFLGMAAYRMFQADFDYPQ